MKHPQQKGKRAEYQVRDILRSHGYKTERNPMSGAIEWLKGDLRTDLPFFVEVKNVEHAKFLEWWKKADDQAKQTGTKPPIIIWTKNNEDYYCFLSLDHFLKSLENERKDKPIATTSSDLPFSKAKQTHRKLTP